MGQRLKTSRGSARRHQKAAKDGGVGMARKEMAGEQQQQM